MTMLPDLASYHWIVLNSSAGKDSQVMLDVVVERCDQAGVPRDRLVVAHADLGRVEWPGTRALAEEQARHYGLAFVAVSRPQGDLLDHIANRGMFPSPAARRSPRCSGRTGAQPRRPTGPRRVDFALICRTLHPNHEEEPSACHTLS